MQNRIANYSKLSQEIITWMKKYLETNQLNALVVGVSGGVDSAVTSVLAAQCGCPVFVVSMLIHQVENQTNLAHQHMDFLSKKFSNINLIKVDLSKTFDFFLETIGEVDSQLSNNHLANANSRARLRMMTLYQIAANKKGIVVGTGNKVEDYGIGFFTKYGDGGVDIAPIADLYKSEVYNLAKFMNINQEILKAPPTDGLWDDQRTDEEQIGIAYDELEWVMEKGIHLTSNEIKKIDHEQLKAIKIYKKFHYQNLHKMKPIPIYLINKNKK